MDSYLTEAEIDACQKLHKKTPFLICGVTQTHLSIARHYGGIRYNGDSYTYMPPTDELVRDDVLKLVTKLRKPPRKAKESR